MRGNMQAHFGGRNYAGDLEGAWNASLDDCPRLEAADESFRQALARAREQQAEVWAEEMLSISDDELPTHEAIGRARLRMQSRQWLAGKYNPTYADKPTQVGVNVGVAVVLPEAERLKLLERHERAMLANQDKSGESHGNGPQFK
jgi:terminase small subunit-like protein